VSSIGGTMMPSAFAVFKLITSSNLVGRMSGKSSGRPPVQPATFAHWRSKIHSSVVARFAEARARQSGTTLACDH
jgi:hypothetical protein